MATLHEIGESNTMICLHLKRIPASASGVRTALTGGPRRPAFVMDHCKVVPD
jgi:hypothetical protein